MGSSSKVKESNHSTITVETSLYPILLNYSSKGLESLFLISSRKHARANSSSQKSLWIEKLVLKLKAYFNGENVNFKNTPLHLGRLTRLQKRALFKIQEIAYGTTQSYSEIAKSLGNKGYARMVGSTCRMNPFPIVIPCHRVILNNGELGQFSQGKGMKKKLIRLEKIKSQRGLKPSKNTDSRRLS